MLLHRMERPDLAEQMESLTLRGDHREGKGGRCRTFVAADGVRRYSIEMEAADCVVVLDVGHSEQVLALHVSRED